MMTDSEQGTTTTDGGVYPSRSVARRVAAQQGKPAPTFKPAPEQQCEHARVKMMGGVHYCQQCGIHVKVRDFNRAMADTMLHARRLATLAALEALVEKWRKQGGETEMLAVGAVYIRCARELREALKGCQFPKEGE